jgi:hypothetical protein
MTKTQMRPYDVIQVLRDGEWLDFSTLRTSEEFAQAERMVRTGQWDGQALEFRVVRGGRQEIIFSRYATTGDIVMTPNQCPGARTDRRA